MAEGSSAITPVDGVDVDQRVAGDEVDDGRSTPVGARGDVGTRRDVAPAARALGTAARREAAETLEQVLALLGDSEDGRHRVAIEFARAALRRVPASQLAAADPRASAHHLLDAFRFASRRDAHGTAIRVFNPETALDGRRTATTVVQVSAEDRPFLLSTITEELQHRGIGVVRSLHPIVGVERDDQGRLTAIVPARHAEERESFLHLELDARLDDEDAAELAATLASHLDDAADAVHDYDAMREAIGAAADELRRTAPPRIDRAEVDEAVALLEWILEGNLLLLGTRRYEIVDLPAPAADAAGTVGDEPGAEPGDDGGAAVTPEAPSDEAADRGVRVIEDSGTGILADDSTSQLVEPVPLADLPDEQRHRFLHGPVVRVSRTNRLATVHRRARMEYIGIKRFDAGGAVCGEFRILGLFTRQGLTEPARSIPLLRQKLAAILEREDVVPGSHDEAALVALFEALPKDELFQADVDTLHATLIGLLHAEEQRQTTVVTRVDAFTRTVSVVVALPRDRYGPALRRRITALLTDRFDAERVEVDLSLGDRAQTLARFAVHTRTSQIAEVDPAQLELEIVDLARNWVDDVAERLIAMAGEAAGTRLVRQFAERLPRAYQDQVTVERGVADVLALDRLVESSRSLGVELIEGTLGARDVRLRAFRQGAQIELSSFIPILESMGLIVTEEVPFELTGDGPRLFVHNFGVRHARDETIDVLADGDRIAEAVLAAWDGRFEVDSLNRLVLYAGLSWRHVAILRAYRRYRRQVGTAYTAGYLNDTLAANPAVARSLIEYFEGRFEPAGGADAVELAELRDRVLEQCDAVERLDHDRILRGLLALMAATLRTNAYRPDAEAEDAAGRPIPYLSFKIDPHGVPAMPKPVPYREVFVYSSLVEGIHLRGGPVARGGIRWSDRQDDVRTEVLGLMKAQVLKNAVIVPTGAKGGFVVKRPPADREALRAEVERQYVTFIRGLLDVTDTIEDDTVRTPRLVRRHDDDDPYLVVAADRGTATFSDLANRVAASYDFWLGDAFASGGSNGYDHKALGITARGAWLAVRRHFRELGVDTQTEPVTAVGIGDMSGDVFGNGMLSTRTLRLVAAFDHRDIFLDPEPDAAAGFEERERLFRTPGTTWQDYDRDTISRGGGVHSRSSKRIALSPEVRAVLRVDDTELPPNELIRAILSAPVDLLFAGGIGTYVKASTESHADIGDRANDDVRIDAQQLRARVYGEGANLSITQRARIQYARRGGRINQDAIDNAGGVDCSDHEVNVKILLGSAVADGRIDRDARDRLLVQVTDDVVDHVLGDVDRQTAALSKELADSPRTMDTYEALVGLLEDVAGLDRQVEALPSGAEMRERASAGAGLSRPELATLLGYVKRHLATAMLATDLPDQDDLAETLREYFPPLLVARFDDLVGRHRLRRELIAMVVSNEVVDRLGVTFVFRLQQESGASVARILAAYRVACRLVDAGRVWGELHRLEGTLAPERVLDLDRDVGLLVTDLTRRYLQDPALPDVAAVVARDRTLFRAVLDDLMSLGTEDQRARRFERARNLMDDLIDEEIAVFLSCTRDMAIVPDVAAVARSLHRNEEHAGPAVADTFLRLSSALEIDRIQRTLRRFEPDERWARWQVAGLAGDLRRLLRDAVTQALREDASASDAQTVDGFLRRRQPALEHALTLVRSAEALDELRLDAVAVALRALRETVDAG